MTTTYTTYNTLTTPQTEKIPGSNQIPNEAGGWGYPVDDWTRLNWFLNLGSEKGTYYVGETELTKQNAEAVERCIRADGTRVVSTIVEISKSGRAPKNDPALFALAMAIGLGDVKTRQDAASALPEVARTGTHLLHFVQYATQFRGWGNVLKRAVQNWYLTHGSLDLQLVKYASRDKWSQKDVLRLAHPKGASADIEAILRYAAHGVAPAHAKEGHNAQRTATHLEHSLSPDSELKLLWATEQAHKTGATEAEIVRLINDYQLPREVIPTEFLQKPAVWEALLLGGGKYGMPMTAMIRNLATMTRLGVLTDHDKNTDHVVEQLNAEPLLRHARVHPLTLLSALRVYQAGKGEKSSHTWTPITRIVDALDKAFYLSFGNITPTGKRFMIGLDVSGSMDGSRVNGLPFMSCIDAESAMALVTASVEPHYSICAFDTKAYPLTISPRQRLDDVVRAVRSVGHGGTDCAIPIKTATENKMPVDCFIIFTDSESWAGPQHTMQALSQYRRAMRIPAKLVVCAMTATQTSVGNPSDAGVLNIAGLDTNVPQLIAEFV